MTRRRPRPQRSRASLALTRLRPSPPLDPNVASPRPLDEADEATRQNRRAVRGVVLLAVLTIGAIALGYALIQQYKDTGAQARGKLQDTLQSRYNGLAAQVRAGKDVAGQVTVACADPKTRKVLVAEGVSCAQAATVATASPVPGTAPMQGKAGAQGSQGVTGRGIVASTVVGGHLILTYSDSTASDVGRITGPAGSNGSKGDSGSNGADGRGIASTAITASGHLTVTYTDGKTVDLGNVVGPTGSSGSNGVAGSNGTNGVDGKDGASGAAGASGAPGQNGTAGYPPASFSFTVPGLLGDTTYLCTPSGDASAGSQPSYACAAQPAPTSPTGTP